MNKTALQAARELRRHDHAFLAAWRVEEFVRAFGLEGKIEPVTTIADRGNNPKGLTLRDGRRAARGMCAASLARQVCHLLKVDYEDAWGRGEMLRNCCDALERHFAE